MIRTLPTTFALLLIVCHGSFAQEEQANVKPPVGFEQGNTMPFHVVDFVAGTRSEGGGCPTVMISNTRVPGVEIWSLSASDQVFQLTAAIDELAGPKKARAFLVIFNKSAANAVKTKSTAHEIESVFVTVPRSMTAKTFRAAAGNDKSQVIVFFQDRKEVKQVVRLSTDELTAERIEQIAAEAKEFLPEAE